VKIGTLIGNVCIQYAKFFLLLGDKSGRTPSQYGSGVRVRRLLCPIIRISRRNSLNLGRGGGGGGNPALAEIMPSPTTTLRLESPHTGEPHHTLWRDTWNAQNCSTRVIYAN